MSKTCARCKTVKSKLDFHNDKNRHDGLFAYCKACVLDKQKKYTVENRDKIKKYRKVYNAENAEIISKTVRSYYSKNKERILIQCKDYSLKNADKKQIERKEYYKKNKEKIIIASSNYRRERLKTDTLFLIKKRIRTRITNSIKNKGYTKKSKAYSILGCSFEFFKSYIESQFKKGMDWSNIHLDHIKPISKAKTEKEVLDFNHYTNFQPLFKKDNMAKGDKIIQKQLRLI